MRPDGGAVLLHHSRTWGLPNAMSESCDRTIGAAELVKQALPWTVTLAV